jgi:DNA-binding CsgD family transcriptional regulator
MAFELIGLPAAALGRSGRPIAVNPRFLRFMPEVATERRRHLRLVAGTAEAELNDTLTRLAHEQDWSVRAIPLPATDARPPIIMHVIRVRGPARDLFPGVLAIVVATPLAFKGVPAVAELQELFNMTPAEARVTRAIAQRRTVAETARRFELSPETVRSQLKAALGKTGLTRKLDLAVMLAGASLVGASEPER